MAHTLMHADLGCSWLCRPQCFQALEMAKLASLLLRDIPAFEDPFHSALPTVRATHKDFQYNVVSTAPFAVGTQN